MNIRDPNGSVGERLSKASKKRMKKEKFLKTRMWMSVIMSNFFPDRGSIYENIGNSIFIGNNQYATQNSLTSMIYVKEFSLETPVAFISCLVKHVKSTVENVRIDVIIKNTDYMPDLTSGGLDARINQWNATLRDEEALPSSKERAARLLYSKDVVKSKQRIFKSRYYILVRAKDGSHLKKALNSTKEYLDEIDCYYKVVKSDLETHLKYISLLSNKREAKIRDVASNILSVTNLSEMLPSIQGLNDDDGSFLGINRLNMSPYFINFRATAKGKNIYVVGPAGDGKTFLVQNWLVDFYALKYCILISDIKGNDYYALVESLGGYTLDMTPQSIGYINNFRLNPEGVEDPISYYNEMFRISKQKLLILSNLEDKEKAVASAILEDFLRTTYMSLGVTKENKNTWYRTDNLNPYTIYDWFVKFCSKNMIAKHGALLNKMLSNLRSYICRDGSNSRMFLNEYDMKSILESTIVRFNFGMLTSKGFQDESMIEVKNLDRDIISKQFIQAKKANGEWTVVIEEESQIVKKDILRSYTENHTLGRAMNVISIMLGNSIMALANNPDAQALIENINMIAVGGVNETSRKYIVKEFELEKYEDLLYNISNNSKYERTFLLANKMQKDAGAALIKAYVPDSVVKSSLFKNVDTVEE